MGVYKRGDNWYIDFTFHGERVREMIGPSRKGAEKVIAKRKAEIAENKFLDVRKDPDPVKFHDFAVEYMQWAKANKKPSTYEKDTSIMRALEAEFGLKTLQEITAWQIEKWKAAQKENHNVSSVNRTLAVLKHFLNKAVEWGKLKENPAKRVKLFKGVTSRIRYLMPPEVHTLLSNCEGMVQDISTVAVHTGMRKSEILDLMPEHVDLEKRIVSALDTKNHERRDVPIDRTVRDILARLMQGRERGTYIFHSSTGTRFGRCALHSSFHEALKKSGITDFHFHDLRHTFASNLVMAGKDLNTVRELLGHKDLKMTLRYAHLAPNLKREAVDTLDRVLTQAQDMSLNPPRAQSVGNVIHITD